MDYECASKRYETSFKKLLEKNIDRSKIASMIYGVSGNGKKGIDFVKPKNYMFKPKPKKTMINPKDLYSNLTYGYTNNIYYAHKPYVNKTSGRTNHKGSKKIWVPKAKIIYVANILSSQVETPIMVPGL